MEESDRDYLPFFWWKNSDLDLHPQEYRIMVHLFGVTSSPGCANYGLKYLVKEKEHVHPIHSKFITKDLDTGVTSVTSTEKVVQLAKEA